MAEIDFPIPVCLSKATQDWQEKPQTFDVGSNVHGARSEAANHLGCRQR